jgi:hypothetical protein
VGYLFNLQVTSQSKYSPVGRKLTQSGHLVHHYDFVSNFELRVRFRAFKSNDLCTYIETGVNATISKFTTTTIALYTVD